MTIVLNRGCLPPVSILLWEYFVRGIRDEKKKKSCIFQSGKFWIVYSLEVLLTKLFLSSFLAFSFYFLQLKEQSLMCQHSLFPGVFLVQFQKFIRYILNLLSNLTWEFYQIFPHYKTRVSDFPSSSNSSSDIFPASSNSPQGLLLVVEAVPDHLDFCNGGTRFLCTSFRNSSH